MLEDLSHHILDIAENSANAASTAVEIEFDERGEFIEVSIRDNGKGMDEETARAVLNPFVTSRTTRRVGLGLPLLKQMTEMCGGNFSLSTLTGKGTTVSASFRKDSIDTPPPGDIPSTLVTLMLSRGDIRWSYLHKTGKGEFFLDSEELASALGENFSSDISLLGSVKEYISENLMDIGWTPYQYSSLPEAEREVTEEECR